ncbi:MAG: hydrogenase cytochrome b subunit [Thermoproteus sp.]
MKARVVGSLIATAITVGVSWVIVYYLSWIPLQQTWPQFWSFVATRGFALNNLEFWDLGVSVFFDVLILLVTAYSTYWTLGHFAVYASEYDRWRKLVVSPNKVDRWNVWQRVQHILMFVTFVVCAFTGFVAMYANEPYWRDFYINGVVSFSGSPPYFLFPSFTGPVTTIIFIHIISGIIMGVLVIAHFAYYGTRVLVDLAKRRPIMERWPILRLYTWGFVKYLVARSIWLVKPSYKLPEWTHKYDPEQLFEYWGVYWGIAILGIPGVLMAIWGPSAFDGLAFLFHTKEAVLAVSFLLIVHLTYTHFMPHIFPYNSTFHSGKMSLELAKEEHPLWYQAISREQK